MSCLSTSSLCYRKRNMGEPAKGEEVISTNYRNVSEEEEGSESEVLGQLQKNQNFVTGSQGLASESESNDHSSSCSLVCSDDSISDDDSLIEIELPEVKYFGPKDLMGLLSEINEINEEENLIEIDISMGSIKCSRVEIKA